MATPSNETRKPALGRVDLRNARFPLGLKISSMMAIIFLTLGSVTVLVAVDQMVGVLVEEFRTKGAGLARGLAAASEPSLSRGERASVHRFVKEFGAIDGLVYVAVSGPAGDVISHNLGDSLPRALRVAIANESEQMRGQATPLLHAGRIEGLGDLVRATHPIAGGVLGQTHVGLRLSDIEDQIAALWMRLGIVFASFAILGIVAAFVFGRLVVRPLFNMVGTVVEVSTGNLGVRAEARSQDEFSSLGRSVNDMIASLRDIVSSVRFASVQVNDAAEEIVATSNEQERGVREQVASIEEIAQTMDALAGTARAIANNADSLTELSESMSATVKTGQITLHTSQEAMAEIVDKNGVIADRINRLHEQSDTIISVIDIIDSISDRLDLLALNAALEGSRAGEVGKGFSLVAHEMRRLAESVTLSTKEIKDTVQEIHGLTKAALEASQQGNETTSCGALEMQKTVDVMSRIFGLIDQTTEEARQIKAITQQQLSSSQQIVAATRDVTLIATGGMNAAQEVTKAAQEQARLSARLREQVAVFRVGRADADSGEKEQAQP